MVLIELLKFYFEMAIDKIIKYTIERDDVSKKRALGFQPQSAIYLFYLSFLFTFSDTFFLYTTLENTANKSLIGLRFFTPSKTSPLFQLKL